MWPFGSSDDEEARNKDLPTEEEREEKEAEEKLERIKKKYRIILISKLSSGDFKEAEEKCKGIFPNDERYYIAAGSVAEFLMSKNLSRAEKRIPKAIRKSKLVIKNEGNEHSIQIAAGKVEDSLERAEENLAKSPEEIRKAASIIDHYSEEFSKIDKEGYPNLLEYLEELLEEKRERPEDLERVCEKLRAAINEAKTGNTEPLKQILDGNK